MLTLRWCRERKIWGDNVMRTPEGTGEYGKRWQAAKGTTASNVLYRRMSTNPDAEDTYRTCLQQLGPDAPECATLLETAKSDPAQRLTSQREVLGHRKNQAVAGFCGMMPTTTKDATAEYLGGSRLRSGLCQNFCGTESVRGDGLCSHKLTEYCASQRKAGLNEESCHCYLPEDAYKEVRAEANKVIGESSELAQKVNAALDQYNVRNDCWYTPCQKMNPSLGPLTSSCPVQNIKVCVQNASDNALQAARDINIIQKCDFDGTGGPAKPPVSPPTGGGGTGTGGGGGGTGTGGGGGDNTKPPSTTTTPTTPPPAADQPPSADQAAIEEQQKEEQAKKVKIVAASAAGASVLALGIKLLFFR